MSESTVDVNKLAPEERLRLLEELWDSLSDQDLPVTSAQQKELDRRLDDLDREGPRGIPWEDVLERLQPN